MAKLTFSAACAAGGVAVLHGTRALGGSVPAPIMRVVAGASAALAATLAARHVVRLWRGPGVAPFDRRDAVFCDVAEAAEIRAAAQLRTRTGGAGYVGRPTLLLPAATWAAVALEAAAFALAESPLLWPLVAAALGAALGVAFPPTSFQYLEAGGGCVLVHPALVGLRLVEAAGVPPALTRFDPSRSGTSPDPATPPPRTGYAPGGEHPPVRSGGGERTAGEEHGEDDRWA